MKNILFLLLFLLPLAAFAQYPNAPNKIVLGRQTTGDGLIYRTDSIPNWTPATNRDAWVAFDTEAGVLYYYEGGTWNGFTGGAGGGELSDAYISNDTLYLLTPDSTYTILIPAGADDWGTQVVEKDSTLRGNGTLADPLRVNRDTFPTRGTLADTASALRTDIGLRPTGTGTPGRLPLWATSSSLSDSGVSDDNAGLITVLGTRALRLPVGPISNRSGTPAAGEARVNSTTGLPEVYTDMWRAIQVQSVPSNYMTYGAANGQIVGDSIVFYNGSLNIRKNASAGTVDALVVGRVFGSFPGIEGNPFKIQYSGGQAFLVGANSANTINFTSNDLRMPTGGPVMFRQSGTAWHSGNGRPGYFASEMNDQIGTRIYRHMFGESLPGLTTPGNERWVSPFTISMPARNARTNFDVLGSKITGFLVRQSITADSSNFARELMAFSLMPSYNSNSQASVSAWGIRYAPTNLTSVVNHYAITTTSGLVGFRTETPAEALHVNGQIRSDTLTATAESIAGWTGTSGPGVAARLAVGPGLSLSSGTLDTRVQYAIVTLDSSTHTMWFMSSSTVPDSVGNLQITDIGGIFTVSAGKKTVIYSGVAGYFLINYSTSFRGIEGNHDSHVWRNGTLVSSSRTRTEVGTLNCNMAGNTVVQLQPGDRLQFGYTPDNHAGDNAITTSLLTISITRI